ncbi:MAG: hypothetical protein AB7N76_00845 [Planctomycetota bacterium]
MELVRRSAAPTPLLRLALTGLPESPDLWLSLWLESTRRSERRKVLFRVKEVPLASPVDPDALLLSIEHMLATKGETPAEVLELRNLVDELRSGGAVAPE